jgi:hypothetical protein
MRTFAMLLLSLASALLSQAQSAPAAEFPTPVRTYHLLREDDDWSFLADPAQRQEFGGPHQIHLLATWSERLVPLHRR